MARLTFRQGIVRHQTDTFNNPTFLLPVGNFVNLNVSPDFTIIAFVHGTSSYLYTESASITNAWGPFTPPNDYWLYWDLNLVTGIVTRGITTLEPIESPAAPPTPATGQMWFNTATNIMYAYNGSSFAEVVRVLAAKYTNATTLQSVSINTPLFTGTQVGLTASTRTGSLIFDSAGKPIKTGAGNRFFTTENEFVTGVPTGASLRVNNIIVSGQTNAPIAAYQVVQFNDFAQIGIADPFQQGLRVFGIVEEDAVTNEVVNFLVEGMIYNPAWNWSAAGANANDPVYADTNGMISLTPSIPDQLPVGIVIGIQEILFAPGLFPQITANIAAVTDHGLLNAASLLDDDHPQYHNDARGDARYLQLTGGSLSGNLVMGASTDVTLPDLPTNATDAANKAYVDQVAAGIKARPAVRVRIVGALPASTYANGASGVGAQITADVNGALPAIDGITLSVGDRLLIADQASASENGVYDVFDLGSAGTPWILQRCTDCDESNEIPSSYVFVQEGTTYADSGYVATITANPFVVGTDDITWILFITGTIPDQNLWETIVSDSGSAVANIATDSLSILGGAGIDTAIVGDVLTITGIDQNIWETIVSDSGSAVANSNVDSLSILGGTGIDTAIVGDVLTISAAVVAAPTLALAFGGFGSEGAALSTVYTSDNDITTWTGANPSHGVSFVTPSGAAYAPSIDTWVYTTKGANPNAFYSTDDGATWTAAARVDFFVGAANSATGKNLAWSPTLGLFIMGGNSGHIQKSSDGIIWSNSTDAPRNTGTFLFSQILSVTWSPDLALFFCGTTNNEVGFSADGDTWTLTATEPGGAGSNDIDSVYVVGTRVFVGRDNGSIWYSDNSGATWTQSTLNVAVGGFQPSLGFAANDDGSVIVMGGVGLNNAGFVWRSVDSGLNFTQIDVATQVSIVTMYSFCIIFDTDYGFIMGGRNAVPDEHMIVTSTDGLTWTLRLSEQFGAPLDGNDFQAIASKKQNGLVPGAAGPGDPDQNLWETIVSDSGSAVANSVTDSLSIVGGTGISTAIIGDILTITASGGGGGDSITDADANTSITTEASVDENIIRFNTGPLADFPANTNTMVLDSSQLTVNFADATGVAAVGSGVSFTLGRGGDTSGDGGTFSITGGFSYNAQGGGFVVTGGYGYYNNGGPVSLTGGYGRYGLGGGVSITGGDSYDGGAGGGIVITGGSAGSTGYNIQGGDVSLVGGTGDGTDRGGNIVITPGLGGSGGTGAIVITQRAAPSVTTDKLYNVTGDLYWNGNNLTSASDLPHPYDVAMMVFGEAPAGGSALKFVAPSAFTLFDYGHQADADSDPTTGNRVFDVTVNAVSIGTLRFNSAGGNNGYNIDFGNSGVGINTSGGPVINVAAGDIIRIINPSDGDSQGSTGVGNTGLEDISIVLRGHLLPANPSGAPTLTVPALTQEITTSTITMTVSGTFTHFEVSIIAHGSVAETGVPATTTFYPLSDTTGSGFGGVLDLDIDDLNLVFENVVRESQYVVLPGDTTTFDIIPNIASQIYYLYRVVGFGPAGITTAVGTFQAAGI